MPTWAMPLSFRNWTKLTAKKLLPTPPLPLRIRSSRLTGWEESPYGLGQSAVRVFGRIEPDQFRSHRLEWVRKPTRWAALVEHLHRDQCLENLLTQGVCV